MNASPCPSLTDLLSRPPDDPSLVAHLRDCARCRALLAQAQATNQPSDEGQSTDPLVPSLGGLDVADLRPGMVCAVAYGLSDEYMVAVVVDADAQDLVVVPISDDVRHATEWDLILDSASLGYEAVAEVWNHGPVLHEQVHEILAQLSEEELRQLDALYDAALNSQEVPADLATGVPVLGDQDPRLLGQDEQRERWQVYFEPAQELEQIETFGQLLAEHADEQALDLAELEDLLDEPHWFERLRNDDLDLNANLPVAALMKLLQRLSIALHEGTARLVYEAVAKTCEPPASQELQLARRRTGSRAQGRRAQASEDERRAVATRYVQSLWRAAGRGS
jgi:hypothetical protein